MPPVPGQTPIERAGVRFRLIAPSDSIEELTELLHRAYKRLGDMGFRYVATYQEPETTRKRIAGRECYVGVQDDRIVATVTIAPPEFVGEPPWYDQPEVACFQQFAVEPALQGLGIGSAMMDLVERRARELGARELGLDTSEGATHLIEYYKKRGYRFIDYIQWSVTNYRSVILSKTL
ncbi:GNAT family N-acetyltransferase [Candidatus Poribacteria bacterium]|nr:GNAT family N-acetyltransferase [Candidatus Poribacteria bacterium]